MLKRVRASFRRQQYIIVLAILICGIGYCSLQKGIAGLYHDDGIYIVGAQSISQGTGYHIISLPGSPAQTKYPILYSYVLSWLWSIAPAFPENISLLKAANLFFVFLIVITAYGLYRASICERGIDAYVYAGLVGANPGIFSFVDIAVSDVLFVWLVLLGCCISVTDADVRLRNWRPVTLAIIGVLAVLTRTAGVPLPLAGLVHFLLARRWRQLALYIVTFVVAMLPWFVWCIFHKAHVLDSSLLSYYVQYDLRHTAFYLTVADPLRAAQMFWGNVRYFFDALDLIWLLGLFPGLQLRILMLTLLVVGFYTSIRKLSNFLTSFLIFYMILILGWPFNPTRYALPILPLLLLLLFRGIHTVQDGAQRLWQEVADGRWLPVLVRTPIYLVVCFNIAWLASTLQPSNDRWVRGAYGQRLDYSWSGFVETFSWIRSHTLKEDLLATAYDPMYYLYTGRKAILPMFHKPDTYFYPYGLAMPDVGSVEEIKSEFRRLKVRYLITNPLDQYAEGKAVDTLVPRLLASFSTRPRLVFSSRDEKHKIYEIPSAE